MFLNRNFYPIQWIDFIKTLKSGVENVLLV